MLKAPIYPRQSPQQSLPKPPLPKPSPLSDELLHEWKNNRHVLRFHLMNGETLAGRVVSIERYLLEVVLLDGEGGTSRRVGLMKHAVAYISEAT